MIVCRSLVIVIPLTLCFLPMCACVRTPAVVQTDPGAIDIVSVYPPNERFYLRASGCSRTPVHEAGRREPLYMIDDGLSQWGAQAFLSNDGRVVVYVNMSDGSESVSVYRDGRLVRSLTSSEVTGCDGRRERCQLVYSNGEQVLDHRAMSSAPEGQQRIFKAGVSEQERFLNEFPLFSSGDAVYVIDSRRRVHQFSLADGTMADAVALDDVYPGIMRLASETKTEDQFVQAPEYSPNSLLVAGGGKAADALGRRLYLKAVADRVDQGFRIHTFLVSGTLFRDGRFEVAELDVLGDLERQRLLDFFATTRFDTRLIPHPCDWWYLNNQTFEFRNPDKAVARREQTAYMLEQQKELQASLTAERLEGIYIPRDLGECFVELDKMLAEVSRNEMRALPKREGMIRVPHGPRHGTSQQLGAVEGIAPAEVLHGRRRKAPGRHVRDHPRLLLRLAARRQ